MTATLSAPAPATAPAVEPLQRRDGFLDLVRAVATVRVVTWHAYGAPFLSWIVAAIPAMFFVTGCLLATSARRRPPWLVVADRFRRIALPLWCFAALGWVGLLVAGAAVDEPAPLGLALRWFVPLVDPEGPPWEGGWLSSPLWYIRALLWVLLAAPLLLRAVRRWPRLTLAGGVVAVLAADHLVRAGARTPAFAPRLWWYAGDLALYGTFTAAGARFASGGLPKRPAARASVAAVAAVLGIAWFATHDVPRAVVNNSQVLHLCVGSAWLAAALAAERPLRAVAAAPLVREAIGALGRRALTVYLWHGVAIAAALAVLDLLAPTRPWPAHVGYPVLVVAGIIAATGAFGRIEDWAAGRRRHGPRRAGRVVLGAVAVTAVLAAGAHAEPVHRPPTPSQRPPLPSELRIQRSGIAPFERLDDDALGHLVSRWLDRTAARGVVLAVTDPGGATWSAAAGRWPDGGAPVAIADRFDAMSVMKTVTAALVLQAAAEGRVSLDGPLPRIDGVTPRSALRGITVRDLLGHRSGLADFRASPEWVDAVESGVVLSPQDTLRGALRLRRTGPAKSSVEYTSTNYLLLGLLLEHVHGRPFAELVSERVLRPLGMTDSAVLPPSVGLPNVGGGGLVTTVDDLLRLARHTLVDGAGLGPARRHTLLAADRDTGMAHGTMAFCPCTEARGPGRFTFVGHAGGGTLVLAMPSTGVTIALHVTDGIWEPAGRFDDAIALAVDVGELAGRAATAT